MLGNFNATDKEERIFAWQHSREIQSAWSNKIKRDQAERHRRAYIYVDFHTRTSIKPYDSAVGSHHFVIDGRHVHIFGRPNIDSDHYLVLAKIRTSLWVSKNVRQQTESDFDVKKLQSKTENRTVCYSTWTPAFWQRSWAIRYKWTAERQLKLTIYI